MADPDYEDYYPPRCIHCESSLSSVLLHKSYNWNQEKQDYFPDDYEPTFNCPSCNGEVGEITKEGKRKWYVPKDFHSQPSGEKTT